MKDYLILFMSGVFFFITGVLVQKRDKKLFENAVQTKAKVISYDEYQSTGHSEGGGQHTMYTMNVTYSLSDGSVVEAKEQCGRGHKKYPVGEYIDISYSREKLEYFSICGDYSRKIAFVIITILGLGMMGVSVYFLVSVIR